MDQYINKKDLINMLAEAPIYVSGLRFGKTILRDYTNKLRESLIELIRNTPPAEVAPVVHANWIVVGKTEAGSKILKCGHCGRERKGSHKSAFCRDCGAMMDLPTYILEEQESFKLE